MIYLYIEINLSNKKLCTRFMCEYNHQPIIYVIKNLRFKSLRFQVEVKDSNIVEMFNVCRLTKA